MFTRRILFCGIAALALLAVAVTAGKPPPPPPPPSPPDPAILYSFNYSANGGHEVWVMNADGSNRTPIITYGTHGLYADAYPSWSGDNTKFVFMGRPVIQRYDLYVSNIDGSSCRMILEGGEWTIGEPDWSPAPLPGQPADAEWIFFTCWVGPSTHRDLYAIRSDGTGLVQLTDTPDLDEFNVSVSHDGTCVVYTAQHPYPSFEADVYRGALGTGGDGLPVITDVTSLTDAPGSPLASAFTCFSNDVDPTGTYVIIEWRGSGGNPWLVPLASPETAQQMPIPGSPWGWLDDQGLLSGITKKGKGSGDYVVHANVFTGVQTILFRSGDSNNGLGLLVPRRWHASQ